MGPAVLGFDEESGFEYLFLGIAFFHHIFFQGAPVIEAEPQLEIPDRFFTQAAFLYIPPGRFRRR
jgi:hypothetical protein